MSIFLLARDLGCRQADRLAHLLVPLLVAVLAPAVELFGGNRSGVAGIGFPGQQEAGVQPVLAQLPGSGDVFANAFFPEQAAGQQQGQRFSSPPPW